MPKKGYSVSMDIGEKAEIDAIIERRRTSGDRRDRELDFSKWMREAIFEKLERERPSKTPEVTPGPARRGRRGGTGDVEGARKTRYADSSGSSSTFSMSDGRVAATPKIEDK